MHILSCKTIDLAKSPTPLETNLKLEDDRFKTDARNMFSLNIASNIMQLISR